MADKLITDITEIDNISNDFYDDYFITGYNSEIGEYIYPEEIIWYSSVYIENPNRDFYANGFAESDLVTPNYTNFIVQQITLNMLDVSSILPTCLEAVKVIENCINDIYTNNIDYANVIYMGEN